MVEQKWERNGRRILNLATGDAEIYDTFNGAKRNKSSEKDWPKIKAIFCLKSNFLGTIIYSPSE